MSRKNLGRVVFYSLFIGTLAWLGHKYWYTMTVPISVQEDDIREAVVLQSLGEQLVGCGPASACCMSIDGKVDPTDAFLARFHGRFRKGSECERENKSPSAARMTLMIEIGNVQ